MDPDAPIFVLAFDHRSVLQSLFGTSTALQPDTVRTMKTMVCQAAINAADAVRAGGGRPGILIDEETGGHELARARAAGLLLSVPLERSGAPTFTLEYGEAFLDHLRSTRPDHAKVLVFLNPDTDGYREQIDRLAAVLGSVQAAGWPIMVEFVVPPTSRQLADVGGESVEFDRRTRARLMITTIEDCYAVGLRPELWKLEGLETTVDCARIAGTVARHDPQARSIVLGRGADDARVDGWLARAAVTPGFGGFAIGRSIWYEPLRCWQVDHAPAGTVVEELTANYLRFVQVYQSARSPAPSSLAPSGPAPSGPAVQISRPAP